MSILSRTDNSVVGRWWWTVDRWTIAALGLLIALGGVLTLAASPAVANRIGLTNFHFVIRQVVFLAPAVLLMFAVSLLSPVNIRRLAVLVLIGGLCLMAFTLVAGVEVKGARRWIYLGGLSLQPSEFIKPSFAVVAAWMFAEAKKSNGVPGNLIAIALYGVVMGLLLKQPDIGMAVVVTAVWGAQFFVAGLPMLLVGGLGIFAVGGLAGAYALFPHFAARIDKFRDPAGHENYQIDRAMEAFASGGLFGRGPGEGAVKSVLPDAHTDFIFAVAGEEYGLLLCLLIIGIFAFIVLRGMARVLQENNLFVLLAATGLLTQFGLQAVINIGVNLHLLPTKGMTLPFISYGGSSLIALALGMGMMLGLTRIRPQGMGDQL